MDTPSDAAPRVFHGATAVSGNPVEPICSLQVNASVIVMSPPSVASGLTGDKKSGSYPLATGIVVNHAYRIALRRQKEAGTGVRGGRPDSACELTGTRSRFLQHDDPC
ncbi:hypothetical protein JW905_17685 [bacterium]|nr:hypothetical protein [candidate division CSSED10-310 bacterium]